MTDSPFSRFWSGVFRRLPYRTASPSDSDPGGFDAVASLGIRRFIEGICLASAGDLNQALERLNEAIELLPWVMVTYRWRGVVRCQLGDYAGALADANRLLASANHQRAGRLVRGRVYHAQKEYPSALAELNHAVRTPAAETPLQAAETIYWRGRVHLDMGEAAGACADFDLALRLNTDEADGYFWRGRAHAQLGALEAGCRDLTRALELQPGAPAYHLARGEMHLASRNYLAALADANWAIQLAPEAAEGHALRRQVCAAWDQAGRSP